MQISLSFPSIPINQVSNFSELIYQVLSGELKTDKALEQYFKRNKIQNPSEKKKLHDYCFLLLYWWLRIQKTFPNETKSTTKLVHFLNKSGKIKLDEGEEEHINLAMPKAFFEKVKSDWPNDYSKILIALNNLPVIYLRVNTLLGFKPDQILERLIQAGAKAELSGLVAIKITNAFNLYSSEIFREGAAEQQDIASQMVSEFLNPLPGDRIVDACAGNGGKSLHLAALTQNKGKILSLDIYSRKIEEMRKRLRKAGVNNVEAKVMDSQKTIKRLYGTFDKVLIDAPCTGSGVYRRNPDAKYHFSTVMLQNLLIDQEEILNVYSKLAKKGGHVVYATCSVLKDEGENQIVRFLNKNKSFVLVDEKRIMPYDFDCDGFYMAKLLRVE